MKLLVACIASVAFASQSPDAPDWQAAAGGKMAFEVASVKLSTATFSPPNFPLDSGDAFTNMRTKEPPRGYFKADFPLMVFIQFAYKLVASSEQMKSLQASLPKQVANAHFQIEARADGNPTKDQMRLMMQALLADRFKLAVHFETQEVPAFALTLIKPGKTGPNLRPHADGPACDSPAAETFPPVCDVYAMQMKPGGVQRLGSRNTTIDRLASSISSFARLGRTVVDKTGLTGRFDFTIEWTPDPDVPAPPDKDTHSDPPGTTFLEALREQFGMKLESTRGRIQTLVVDKAEIPSEN
jgi:bla regulator protein BlaR1